MYRSGLIELEAVVAVAKLRNFRAAATELGMAFYPLEKIVFASDCPFDPEKGTMYIRETLRIIDKLKLTKEQRDQVYYKNLERITGKKFT